MAKYAWKIAQSKICQEFRDKIGALFEKCTISVHCTEFQCKGTHWGRYIFCQTWESKELSPAQDKLYCLDTLILGYYNGLCNKDKER